MMLDNGITIEDEQLKKCQLEIVGVLRNYTSDLKLAKFIVSQIDLDNFATIKDD